MAVDTASKRYTISLLTIPWRMVATVPDNATSATDRIADGYLYAGITPGAAVLAGFICMRTGSDKSYLQVPKLTGTIQVPKATGTISCG